MEMQNVMGQEFFIGKKDEFNFEEEDDDVEDDIDADDKDDGVDPEQEEKDTW